jgi:hypothetical protein
MTRAQRFTFASSLSRYRKPLWQSVFWPAAIAVAYGAGILTAMLP